MSFEDDYRELMATPIDEIRQDIFFRADNFQNEPWYGSFLIYTRIGICQPPEEHVMEVRKALKIMGYGTHTTVRDGKTYVVPGEVRQAAQKPPTRKRDMER